MSRCVDEIGPIVLPPSSFDSFTKGWIRISVPSISCLITAIEYPSEVYFCFALIFIEIPSFILPRFVGSVFPKCAGWAACAASADKI